MKHSRHALRYVDFYPEPVDAFIHWEGEAIICAHSGRDIPSAHGIPEEA